MPRSAKEYKALVVFKQKFTLKLLITSNKGLLMLLFLFRRKSGFGDFRQKSVARQKWPFFNFLFCYYYVAYAAAETY